MSRNDRLALLVSLAAILAAAFVSLRIYEGLPHIEDEIAFTWQAKLIARGQLTVPSPQPCPKCFLVPFVVDYNGQRFGKYPLGWPVVLALGEALNARQIVNPLLAGLGVWLTYLLGKKLNGEGTGLLAALLTATSPFFLMNSGSLLSHPWSLVLSLAFSMAWLDAFTQPNPRLPARLARSLPTLTAGLCMAGLALTRPLTAVGLALPFGAHGLYLLLRADPATRKRLLVFGLLAGCLALLHIAWQFAVTGNPLLNPYMLWWPYDTIGFGPGVGLQEDGYLLHDAWINAQVSLSFGASDLFGWPGLSWLFMPLGGYAIFRQQHLRRSAGAWLAAAILPALVLIYTVYWIGSWLYGPRYYYEGLFSAAFLTALGMQWLVGALPWRSSSGRQVLQFPWHGWQTLRYVLSSALVVTLMACNLLFYVPSRLGGMTGLYGVSRDCYRPFETAPARVAIPALVFVHMHKWIEFGCMIDMSSPFMDSEFVLAISRNPQIDAAIAAELPERNVLHYYPETRRFISSRQENSPQ